MVAEGMHVLLLAVPTPACQYPGVNETPHLWKYPHLVGPIPLWQLGYAPPELRKQAVYSSCVLCPSQGGSYLTTKVVQVLCCRCSAEVTQNQVVVRVVACVPLMEHTIVRPHEVVSTGAHLLASY